METLYLSERNLRTLLSKIERQKAGDITTCAILKYRKTGYEFEQTMDAIMVVAVQDDVYYPAQEREPGEVHPLDTPK